MAQLELHDLAAAYALNALDPEDRWTYERHLDTCERCRDEVAALRESAAQLAYAAEGPEPRPELRERILQAVRAERPATVTPLRRRWLFPTTAVAAVAASVAAIGLGLWANSLRDGTTGERVVAFQGGPASLVVAGAQASIVICGPNPPAGKTYQAWVIRAGTPRPAGLLPNGCQSLVLEHSVEPGDTVAVSVEDEGGSITPHDVFMRANV